MNNYKPSDHDIVGEMKRQFKRFIQECKTLDIEQKRALIEEIGSNHIDNRFSAESFIEDAVSFSVTRWSSYNFKISELWKDIAKANAAVNNKPHEVANETVAVFKKQFEIES